VDNSIKLKKLQVVSEALKKCDKGLILFFLISKGFYLGEEERMG